MNDKFEHIDREETVISIQEENLEVFHKTFTVEEFCNWLYGYLNETSYLSNDESEMWTKEGVKARVLIPNQNWKTGKVRISLEFIPDETESPLDDVRQGNKTDET